MLLIPLCNLPAHELCHTVMFYANTGALATQNGARKIWLKIPPSLPTGGIAIMQKTVEP